MVSSANFSAVLRGSSLFRDLHESAAKLLLETARTQRFAKRAKLLREGEKPKFVLIVLDGLVGLFATHNGEETTIEVKGPGSTLFLPAVMLDEVSLTSVRTLAPSQIVVIPARHMRDCCEREPAIARAVIKILAQQFKGSERTLKNMKLRSSTERLANWLLQFKRDSDGCIVLPFDKRTLASCLGMSAENLSRNLRTLKKHGVHNSGQKIIIEDRAALLEFAKPNELIDEQHAKCSPEIAFDPRQCGSNPRHDDSSKKTAMTKTAAPHPDYESLQWILNSIAQWVVKYRNACKAREELSNCTADDIAAIARDLRISSGELASLAQKGPDAANLLRKLLVGLGVDPEALEHGDPVVMRDLQRLCITCGHKRRCELDIANGLITQNFREYCPNVYTLDALMKGKQ